MKSVDSGSLRPDPAASANPHAPAAMNTRVTILRPFQFDVQAHENALKIIDLQ